MTYLGIKIVLKIHNLSHMNNNQKWTIFKISSVYLPEESTTKVYVQYAPSENKIKLIWFQEQ